VLSLNRGEEALDDAVPLAPAKAVFGWFSGVRYAKHAPVLPMKPHHSLLDPWIGSRPMLPNSCPHRAVGPMPGSPPWIVGFSHRTLERVAGVARHKAATCLLAIVVTIGLRLALLPWLPIPKPFVADEYSYLLGAHTFASGHVANPMHPMWVHFETLHQLMRPTYATMYPPGQSLVLALGEKLFGHPWYGVLISFGFFVGCVCWMLQNWMPPAYAALGTAITFANISILGYWMNSYWGGAVAAAAGCLLIGVVPRVARRIRARDAAIAAVAIVVLGNTRPFEGLLLTIAAAAALFYLRWKRYRGFSEPFQYKPLIPAALIILAVGALDGYYNYEVTGSAFKMPYVRFYEEYRSAPILLVMSEVRPPIYRHAALANAWQWDLDHFRLLRSSPRRLLAENLSEFRFYFWSLAAFPLTIGFLLARSYRFWLPTIMFGFVWSGLLIESYHFPHYAAPIAGLLPLMVMYGLRCLRIIGGRYGPLIVLTLTLLSVGQGIIRDEEFPWVRRKADFASPCMLANAALRAGGKHLILVRHAADYKDNSDECVYNDIDIDGSPIVWARDMGKARNQELLDYYRGSRNVWLYEPDSHPGTLVRYSAEAGP
jgi:hypothetical protein